MTHKLCFSDHSYFLFVRQYLPTQWQFCFACCTEAAVSTLLDIMHSQSGAARESRELYCTGDTQEILSLYESFLHSHGFSLGACIDSACDLGKSVISLHWSFITINIQWGGYVLESPTLLQINHGLHEICRDVMKFFWRQSGYSLPEIQCAKISILRIKFYAVICFIYI